LSVIGKVPDASAKPVPLTVAPLIVTAAVPVEFSVTVCVIGVLTPTLPKAKLAELAVNVGTGTFN
jgi:hypothetical protein